MGCLTHKTGAVCEIRKEIFVMLMEISEQVFVFMKLEESAADFHSNNFFISKSGFETTASKIEIGNDD